MQIKYKNKNTTTDKLKDTAKQSKVYLQLRDLETHLLHPPYWHPEFTVIIKNNLASKQ